MGFWVRIGTVYPLLEFQRLIFIPKEGAPSLDFSERQSSDDGDKCVTRRK
jgi:hypothetical protein